MSNAKQALFKRVAETQAVGAKLLRLTEGSVSQRLSEFHLGILRNQKSEDLAKLGLSLIYLDGENGPEGYLRSSAFVGSARYVSKRQWFDIIVEPKIGTIRLFSMLEYCSRSVNKIGGTSTISVSGERLTEVVLSYAVQTIYEFLRKHYYRSYELKRDPAAQTVRGRILVAEYMREAYPRLKLHRLPCEYFEYSQDTIENRILLAALDISGRMLALASPGARSRLSQLIAAARSTLSEVSYTRITTREIDLLRYTDQNRHFQTVHQACRLLIAGTSVDLQPGQRLSFMCFALNMNHLFEDYTRRVFRAAFGAPVVLSAKAREFKLEGLSTGIQVDVLIKAPAGTSVGDCKNKIVTRIDTIDFSEGSVKQADIFQVIAYATHRDVAACRAFLVYPMAAEGEDAFLCGARITAFRDLPLRVFLLNLACEPDAVIQGILQHRSEIIPDQPNQ